MPDDHDSRNFTPSAPNQVWLADITEHHTMDGKLHVCLIKDVFADQIVGYFAGSRIKSHIPMNALNITVARREEDAECIVHTDRGSQFRSRKHIRELNRHGVVGSMGLRDLPATTQLWTLAFHGRAGSPRPPWNEAVVLGLS